jgi:hypothetical protein
VEVPIPAPPRRQDWPRLPGDLGRQLDDGRIYDRGLLAFSVALNAVLEAYTRRYGSQGNPGSRHAAHRQG